MTRVNVYPIAVRLLLQVLRVLKPLLLQTVLVLRERLLGHVLKRLAHLVQERIDALLEERRRALTLHNDAHAALGVARHVPQAACDDVAELLARAQDVKRRLGENLCEQRRGDACARLEHAAEVYVVGQRGVGLVRVGDGSRPNGLDAYCKSVTIA